MECNPSVTKTKLQEVAEVSTGTRVTDGVTVGGKMGGRSGVSVRDIL